MSQHCIPPRHKEPRVSFRTLAEKVNHQQVPVYVLLAQLFTFTGNVLKGTAFGHGGIFARYTLIQTDRIWTYTDIF